MIPVVKGWSTEVAQHVAYLGVQVHGGMGFIEETGAAQYARDARITTIYEGTTGIQANDLIGRKIVRDAGAALASAVADMREVERQAAGVANPDVAAIGARLRGALDAFAEAGRFVVETYRADPRAVLAGARRSRSRGHRLRRSALARGAHCRRQARGGRRDGVHAREDRDGAALADHYLTRGGPH
jgi:hypothetical protein